ncbi:MAG: hypothetical protein JWO45_157, partial [Spartobacteria bacterium]|nr:hypothetical protein [Spartobacteria bacterium]
GKTHEGFKIFFPTTHSDLFGIDYNNEIARVDMRSEDGLFLSAEEIRSGNRHVAEDLVLSVNNPPLAGYFMGFGRERLHRRERARKLVALGRAVNRLEFTKKTPR